MQTEHTAHTHIAKENVPLFRMPTLSPTGSHVAFVYAADIWQVAIEGGTAERLTAHSSSHSHPRYSPDGTLLACTSTRTGQGNVYILPLTAHGDVRQLTFHSSACDVQDWTADGISIYYTANRQGLDAREIYRVGHDGTTPVALYGEPYETIDHVQASPDGTMLAWNMTHASWWRKGHDPYSPCHIWFLPLEAPIAQPPPTTHPASISCPSFVPYPYTPRPTPFASGRYPLWAPDGSGIYFIGYDETTGIENIWFQSLHTNDTRQITHYTHGRLLTPAIARHAPILVFVHDWHMWQLDLASGEVVPIPIHVRADTKITPVQVKTWQRWFSNVQLSPDGKKIAFIAHGQIFADFADKETDKDVRQGSAFPVTNTFARESQMVWTPDSKSLMYVSDRHGEDELFRYDFVTRRETQLTHSPAPRRLPCCSPDGKWVAYIRGFDAIELYHLATNETTLFAQGNFVWQSGALAWSPDSCWLAYISLDERFFSNVYVKRVAPRTDCETEQTARQITFLTNTIGYGLIWSYNGRFLVFTSGQYHMATQIIRVDLQPFQPCMREVEFEKLFTDEKEKTSSPEKMLDVATPSPPTPSADTPPSTQQATTDTEQSPEKTTDAVEPVDIVFEGIERRVYVLTSPQLDAVVQAMSHDSKNLLFLAYVAGKVNIWSLPLDEPRRDQPPQQLTANSASKHHVQFTPDDKQFGYLEDGHITIRKYPSARDPVILHTRGDVTVDFEKEKQQVFQEAWRLLRDVFYDPTFRGLDWEDIRKQFAPLAAGAQTHGELQVILNLMVGELQTSHLGAYISHGMPNTDSYTGLLFDTTAHLEEGVYRVAGIVPDSPVALLREPPRLGDYLVAIDGEPLTPHSNIDNMLQRKVGQRLMMRFAPTPNNNNGRDVAIRPIDNNTYASLRYHAWVKTNENYVHHISDGRLGYVHIADMTYSAYQLFLASLDTETYSKDGIVLDIRYNSGGYIATSIIDVLTRRNVIQSSFRGRLATDAYHYAGDRSFNKPTVLVTNEHSASNAEIFAEMYRRLGLGSIVGTPTAGAVIGTVRWTLLNGITFRLPIHTITTPEGDNLEGVGRAVDTHAEQPPGVWAHGHDYQLDAAVACLLATLA